MVRGGVEEDAGEAAGGMTSSPLAPGEPFDRGLKSRQQLRFQASRKLK